MGLRPGTRLGVYEIVGLLGAGGMGEVYRAVDTRLDRHVALKVLPEGVAADPERTARFQREAKVLASLNHPHIAALFGLEEDSGRHFLTMELVDGETLADRIGRAAIPLDEALPIARQIADALEAAHEQGIVHRDLKPANIKLRADGTAKVLDFGLAKALAPDPSAAATALGNSPTITSPAALTGIGVLLGTVAYMSPEQARGQAADRRSDVWAFGCVLYEMLTRQRAFVGEDVSDTIASVLRAEPDWSALPANLPSPLRALLHSCLRKDRSRRLSGMAAVLYVLDQLDDLMPPAAATATRRTARWKFMVAIGAGAVAAILLMAVVMRRPAESPPAPARFAVSLPEGQQFSAASRQLVDISPDGRQIAYIANLRIYLRSLSDLEAHVIPGSENVGDITNLAFSPEGHEIAFAASADSTLKRIAVTGGTPATICSLAGTTAIVGINWTSAGIVFGHTSGIMRVSSAGGTPELLVPRLSDEGFGLSYPRLLPDGSVVFSRGGGRVGVATKILVQSTGGEQKTLIERGADARYVRTGHLVYVDRGTLFAVPFDLRRLAVTGSAAPVVEGVRPGLGAANPGQYAFSENGSLVYVPGPVTQAGGESTLSLADRKGVLESLKLPPGSYSAPRVSSDGRWLAYERNDGREINIWTYELLGATSARRVTYGGNNRYPVWAADSRRLYFQSDREGDRAIFSQALDTGAVERVTSSEVGSEHIPNSVSKNDVLLYDMIKGADAALYTMSLKDRKSAPFRDVRGSKIPTQAVVSPDGQWVAYQSGNSSEHFTFVESMSPSDGSKDQIGIGGRPLWSRDGSELFLVPGPGQFAVVHVKTQPSFSFTMPTAIPRTFGSASPTDIRPFDVTREGKLVVVAPVGLGDSGAGTPQMIVVLNWSAELKRRLPPK